MAFPTVVNTNESNLTTAGTAHTVNLPGSLVAGNLIVIIFGKGSVVATINAVAGWTELVDENLANGLLILARESDGAEGATLGLTSSASTKSSHISYQISGAEDPGTQLPQLSTVATGSSVNPNATTCTPTGGAKDYLWITLFAMAGEAGDVDAFVTTTPTSYTNTLMKTCGTGGVNTGVEVATAIQQLNAASQDASAWTTTINFAWRAYTMAVHPSSAPPPAEIPSLVTARR